MLLSYLEKIHRMDHVKDVWSFHIEEMGKFGFDRLLYGFTRNQIAGSFGDRQDILILTNHDEAFVKPFFDEGMYFHAPMVKWAAENTGACSFSRLVDRADALTVKEREVVEFNHKMGIVAGYTIGFKRGSSRSKGAI